MPYILVFNKSHVLVQYIINMLKQLNNVNKTQPTQSGQPVQSVQPGQYGQPVQPGQYGQPMQPGQYGQPVQPGQPGQYGQPVQPGQPPNQYGQQQPPNQYGQQQPPNQYGQQQPPNQYGQQQPPNQYGQQQPPNQYGQQQPPNQYGQQPPNQYGQQPPNQYGQQQPPNPYGQQSYRQQAPNSYGQQQPPNPYGQQPSTANQLNVTELEKRLQILSQYDIMIILDDSGSMSLNGAHQNTSRWDEAIEACELILDLATKYDTNGIEVYFLNDFNELLITAGQSISNEVSSKNISPNGGTPLGAKLESIFNRYLPIIKQNRTNNITQKPFNIIVITDGAPSDKATVKKSIGNLCRELQKMGIQPNEMFGIQFFQVGLDSGATTFLRELDDDLSREEGIPDIVDCTHQDPNNHMPLKVIIEKALLGAVVSQIDNANYGNPANNNGYNTGTSTSNNYNNATGWGSGNTNYNTNYSTQGWGNTNTNYNRK